jgi:hypothetical protein
MSWNSGDSGSMSAACSRKQSRVRALTLYAGSDATELTSCPLLALSFLPLPLPQHTVNARLDAHEGATESIKSFCIRPVSTQHPEPQTQFICGWRGVSPPFPSLSSPSPLRSPSKTDLLEVGRRAPKNGRPRRKTGRHGWRQSGAPEASPTPGAPGQSRSSSDLGFNGPIRCTSIDAHGTSDVQT